MGLSRPRREELMKSRKRGWLTGPGHLTWLVSPYPEERQTCRVFTTGGDGVDAGEDPVKLGPVLPRGLGVRDELSPYVFACQRNGFGVLKKTVLGGRLMSQSIEKGSVVTKFLEKLSKR